MADARPGVCAVSGGMLSLFMYATPRGPAWTYICIACGIACTFAAPKLLYVPPNSSFVVESEFPCAVDMLAAGGAFAYIFAPA